MLTTEQKSEKFDLYTNKARFSRGVFPQWKRTEMGGKASLCDCSNTAESYQGGTTRG